MNDKTDWYCNNVHCKTGYIILKRTSTQRINNEHKIYKNNSDEFEDIKCNIGIVHGKIYMSVFKESPSKNSIVGSGFARVNGIWKYNSFTFNSMDDEYHTNNKG